MTRHSKNNTASSVFSKAEYSKLSAYYGTQKARLGSDSHRNFDACSLCLSTAISPVSCTKGHLFCKECVMKDLLAQREGIARKKQEMEALQKEEEEERERVRLQARERVLSGGTLALFGKRKEREEAKDDKDEPANKKRKFEFDAESGKKLAQEAEEEAVRQLELEQNEARKSKLPAFWLPSLTPDSKAGLLSLKDVKLQTMCHVAEPSHLLLMKHLIPVTFTTFSSASKSAPSGSKSSNDEETKICPSCQKQLSNTFKLFLMKPCGHIICKTCTDSLVKPSSQCVTCDASLGSKDIIELLREGTGFASGGRAETSKQGTAFQG